MPSGYQATPRCNQPCSRIAGSAGVDGLDLHTRGTHMNDTNENLSTKTDGSGRKRKFEDSDDDFVNTMRTRKIKVEDGFDENLIENNDESYMASFIFIKRKLDETIKGLREHVENMDIRWHETGDLLRDCMHNNFDDRDFKIKVDENFNEEKKSEDQMVTDERIKTEVIRSMDEDKENKYISCSNIIESNTYIADSIDVKIEEEWSAVESDRIGKISEECSKEEQSLANSLIQEFLDLLDGIKDEVTDVEDKESSVFGLQSQGASIGSTETIKNIGLEELSKDVPQNEITRNSVEPKDSPVVELELHKILNDSIEPEEAFKDSSSNEKTTELKTTVEHEETSREHVKDKKSHKSKRRKDEDLTSHKESKCSRKSNENSPKSLVEDKQDEHDKLRTEDNKSTRISKKSTKHKSSHQESEAKSEKIPKPVSPTTESKRSPMHNVKNMNKKENDEPELTKIQEIFLSPIRNIVEESARTGMEDQPTMETGVQQDKMVDAIPTAEGRRSSEEIYQTKTQSNENINKESVTSSATQITVPSPYPRNAIRQLREDAINKGSSDALLPGFTYGEQTSIEFTKRHRFMENSFEDLEDNEMAWCFTSKLPPSSTPKNQLEKPEAHFVTNTSMVPETSVQPTIPRNTPNQLKKPEAHFVTNTNMVPQTSVQPTIPRSNEPSVTDAMQTVGPPANSKVGEKKKKKKRKRNRHRHSQAETTPLNIQNQPSCSGYRPKEKQKVSNNSTGAQAPVIAQSKGTNKKNKTNVDNKLSSLARQLFTTLKMVDNGRKIAIVPSHYPQMKLSVSQGDLIITEISKMLDQVPYGSEVPCFEYTRFVEGILWIQCTNVYATKWLVGVVPNVKPWPGASLRTWSNDDKDNTSSSKIPKLKKMSISISGTPMLTNDILQRLERQNRGLQTQLWVIYLRHDSDHYVTLTVGVDSTSHRQIKEMDYVAYVGLGRAFFKDIV